MKLIIENLPFDLKQHELINLFSGYGNIKVTLITGWKGKSTGKGIIETNSKEVAERILRKNNGITVQGRSVRLSRFKEFPYMFHKRTGRQQGPLKMEPSAFHDMLNQGRYDIAFDVEWKTLTPTALNPCIDPDLNVPANMPVSQNASDDPSDFAGYNNRWLTIDSRMVISPFTVKSALAGGFANIMGGCYRVINKKEPHPKGEVKEGQYYYKGGYKRYRVSMNNRSKPGFIKEITQNPDGSKSVEIHPVTEYYYDQRNPPNGVTFQRGDAYYAVTFEQRHRQFIRSIRPAVGNMNSGEKKVVYFDPYSFGMNAELKAPALGKQHYHRFCMPSGAALSGTIPAFNFETDDTLKKKVYMGDFRHVQQNRNQPRDHRPEGGIWYENLQNLQSGDWVYYHNFYDPIQKKQVVTNIGKNFQFKAMFFHEDAVPKPHTLCQSANNLCPRCRMFGMVEKSDDNTSEAVQSARFKGKFKASALVNPVRISEAQSDNMLIPDVNQTVPLKQWGNEADQKQIIAYQAMLPISGPPKPNKRDEGGYFDNKTGQINGAKLYKHASLESARDILEVDTHPPQDYTHRLRNYVMVCSPNQIFKGTVGAENCSPAEIAASFLLLDSRIKNHGFKLGLGKAFGMGSVSSSVKTVWIRKKDDYDKWTKLEITDQTSVDQIKETLNEHIPGFKNEINTLTAMDDFFRKSGLLKEDEDCVLGYPEPLARNNIGEKKYWDIFKAYL